MKKQGKPVSIIRWIVRAILISLTFVGVYMAISLGIFISVRTNQDYEEIAKTTSAHIAAQLDALSEGDYRYDETTGKLYKGDVEITDEAFWSIHNKDSNIQHTIFWGTTRVLTDVTDDQGKSVVGSQLTDAKTLEATKQSGFYAAHNVKLYGKLYSVCYYPLRNGSEVVGMVFTGVSQDEANKQIINNVIIALIETIVMAVVVIAIISKLITKKAKDFGVNLNEASDVADEKKDHVTELGMTTMENMQQINAAIDQVSLAVTSQASSTEEIMGSMEEFGTSIDVIMSQVDSVSSVTADSVAVIEELKGQIHRLEQVAEENNAEIINISKRVEQDGVAVADISQIIDAINSIAFQITILSFNASVEAARAGEAGKGFAVVADSIKSLSDKTKESLEEITRIVVSVNDQVTETIQASEKLVHENEKMEEALVQTKNRMDQVTSSFDLITKNIQDIKNESEAITRSKNQVVESVSSLAAVSEENAAMSEEMKATSDEVMGSTQHLLREIDQLKEINKIIDQVKFKFSGDDIKV